MGRKSTGTVRLLKNDDDEPQWHARWTIADGTRTDWKPLDVSIEHGPCCARPGWEHFVEAKALAARMAPKMRAASANGGAGETVAEWFARLHAAKEKKGLATVGDMRGRARKWILPDIGRKPMRDGAVRREDIEAIVRRLDAAQAAFMEDGPGKGRLSSSTSGHRAEPAPFARDGRQAPPG
jgi:hypothetical protein